MNRLPCELVLLILKDASYNTILNLRGTSKRLNGIIVNNCRNVLSFSNFHDLIIKLPIICNSFLYKQCMLKSEYRQQSTTLLILVNTKREKAKLLLQKRNKNVIGIKSCIEQEYNIHNLETFLSKAEIKWFQCETSSCRQHNGYISSITNALNALSYDQCTVSSISEGMMGSVFVNESHDNHWLFNLPAHWQKVKIREMS